MLNNTEEQQTKKRILTKVRKNFIYKSSKDNNPYAIDPTSRLLSDQIMLIIPTLCIVAVNRKITINMHFLNSNFNIKNAVIEKKFSSNRAVALSLQKNENNPGVPWEYSVKRLESFGDLNLATWAHRIKGHHDTFPKIMSKYFDLVNSNDSESYTFLETERKKAIKAMEEIESKYAYLKWCVFSNKETTEMLFSSYSEGMLRILDQTPEEFVAWAKSNGLPNCLDGDNEAHINTIQMFLDCVTLKNGAVFTGPEYETFLRDKHGNKRKIIAQYVNVSEPTNEGVILSGYIIVKKSELVEDEINGGSEINEFKQKKLDYNSKQYQGIIEGN